MKNYGKPMVLLTLTAVLLSGCFRPATPPEHKEIGEQTPDSSAETTLPEETSAETTAPPESPAAQERIIVLQNPGGLTFSEEEVVGKWLESPPDPIESLDAPDGSGTVFAKDGADGEAGIYWRDSAGKETKIFTHVPLKEGGSLGDVHYASITGFLDDTHLVCSYSGYECFRGCGIYDTKTGTWSEHNNFYWSVLGIHDGAVYGWEWGDGYKPMSVWRIDLDGTETILGRAGENSHEAWEDLFHPVQYYSSPEFIGGIWIVPAPFTGNAEEPTSLYFFSADAQTLLAEIRLSSPVDNMSLEIEGTHVTVRWQEDESTARAIDEQANSPLDEPMEYSTNTSAGTLRYTPYRIRENPAGLHFHMYPVREERRVGIPYGEDEWFQILYEPGGREGEYAFVRLITVQADGTDRMQEAYMSIEDIPRKFMETEDGFCLSNDMGQAINVRVTESSVGISTDPLSEITGYSSFAASPAKTTAAYEKTELSGEGGVFLRDSAGKETQIFTNVPFLIDNDPNRTRPMEDVISARVLGYLDETHLVCAYDGFERALGCGIYNTETGTWSEHRHNWRIAGIRSGSVYAWEVGDSYLPTAIWRIDADGTETKLAAQGENSHEAWEMLFTQTDVVSSPDFEGGMWILRPWEDRNQSACTYFFSEDTRTLLAAIEWHPEAKSADYLIDGGHVTVFVRVGEEDHIQ